MCVVTKPYWPSWAARVGLVSVLALAVASRAASAQDTPTDLSSMALSDLMDVRIEPVFGASWRTQPATEAPASVTIVTADEIARHGYRTLAEILHAVRGFYTSFDRNYTYIGVRGVAQPGDYNTRVLLLVDGHRMNDNIYEQALIGPESGLDPATFDRVEIIRGPSAALYGTSAVLAVVNVITKSGAALSGWQAAADIGSLGRREARTAFGRRFDADHDLALFGSISDVDGAARLYFPEFDQADTNRGVAEGLDREQAAQVFGRFTIEDVTIRGAVARREKQVPTAAYDTRFGDPRFETVDAYQFLDGEFVERFGAYDVTARGYVHHFRYDGRYPLVEDEDTPLYADYADGLWWGGEGRLTRALPARQRLTVGGELRQNVRQDQGGIYVGEVEPDFELRGSSHVRALYLQDEIRVLPRLLLYAGLRYDAYDDFDSFAPRLAVVFNRSADEAFKYLYGQAFRAPNAYELDYYTPDGRDGHLGPEELRSHEVVWERYVGTYVRTSVSAFANQTGRVITFRTTPDGGYEFVNVGRLDGRGLELEAEFRGTSGYEAQASYVLQETTRAAGEAPMTNSPRQIAQFRLTAPGPKQSLASVDAQWIGSRATLDGGQVDAAMVANLALRVPLAAQLTVSTQIRNLFDRVYADPASAEHTQAGIPQDGRTLRVGLEWRFDIR